MPPPKQPSDEFRPFQLIVRALELEPHEREPFLRQEAAGDRKLFEEALKMLREAEAMPSDPEPAAAEPLRLVTATASAELLKRLMDSARLDETRYQIKDMIGAGGMGRVYLVEDQHLKRSLAMKVPHAISATDPERRPHASVQLGRFLEEAQVTSQLDHPGVVPVHDLGVDKAGQVYFLMRRVTGDTARDAFAKAREGRDGWTIARALEVVLKVCDTMAYAHQKGVLHRDLKPDNIRVGAFGEVYVLDWGLAKVGQQPDRHDLRVAGAPVASDREIDAQANSESSIVTMDGTTVGTPFYMSPEQALSQPLDHRTDIYAIGATLYELLTGKPPYDEVDIRPQQVLDKVRKGPPTRIEQLVAAVPVELVAIVEKAMARIPDHRYSQPSDLAADLRAYLGQRVVSAYRTGALVKLRLWYRRNRALAAALAVATMAILVAFASRFAWADRLAAMDADLGHLAWASQIERLIERSPQLFRWPLQIDALAHWSEKECVPVLDKESEVDDAIARLKAKRTTQLDQAPPARYAELQRQLQWVSSLERAQTLRSGLSTFVAVTLPSWWSDSDVLTLTAAARCRIARKIEYRSIWNEESKGLALAELALAKANQEARAVAVWCRFLPAFRHGAFWSVRVGGRTLADLAREQSTSKQEQQVWYCTSVLSWALVANGRDEEAQKLLKNAIANAPAGGEEAYQKDYEVVDGAIARSVADLEAARAECEELRTLIYADIDWSIESGAERSLYESLIESKRRLSELKKLHGTVAKRLAWARGLQSLSRAHPNASVRWSDVREQIRSDRLYAGQEIELKDEDVLGLVPLGRNPRSGYFEFYDLRSAWNEDIVHPVDPAAIPIPRHREDGSIEVSEATGIVFVLLPGGLVKVGSQRNSRNDEYYDVDHRSTEEHLHTVRLVPFFIAKYEVTVAQWARLWIGAEDLRNPSLGRDIATHPVDRISWNACESLLSSHGMVMPTEAQWEYACRGGTTTPWAAGSRAELARFANLADATAKEKGAAFDCEEWSDEYADLAPVGSFASNAFGLHDMQGNVSEWCRDELSVYGSERDGDGLRTARDSRLRSYRGSNCSVMAKHARSACRFNFDPATTQRFLGLRAVRLLSSG